VIKKLTLISLFVFSFVSIAICGEIVIRKDGKPVLLKEDHTWELVDTSGDKRKVIFRIVDAVDKTASYEIKDDMGEFSHYKSYAGCKYTLAIENRADFKVKVGDFSICTDNKKLFPDFSGRSELVQIGEVLKPGEKYITKGEFQVQTLFKVVKKSKELLTAEEKKIFIEKYGCKAQSGSIYLRGMNIIFSKDAGIADNAVRSFVKGSLIGVYPLKEEIEF